LVEILGSGYIIEYCVSAFNHIQEEKAYRIYITDALKYLAGLNVRYAELIDTTPKDERTFEEITNDVWTRIMGGGEEG
jgi:hypothetical protein